MTAIYLKPLQHKGMERIGIYFDRNVTIQSLLQKQVKAVWSRTHTCWHIPFTKESYESLAGAVSGKGTIYREELNRYLRGKNPDIAISDPETISTSAAACRAVEPAAQVSVPVNEIICPDNLHEFKRYRDQLVLKAYSKSTIRTYCGEFNKFLKTLNGASAKDLAPDQLQRYILYCINTLKLSENTVHSRINALKFYYEQVLHNEKMFFEIPRPKKSAKLPKVLSKERIADLINSIENTKHKTIVMLTYACGLRVSEVVSLKVKHIDGQRKTVYLENAKGKKDRVVSLSPNMLIMLREYYKAYQPKEYLFEGQFKDTHLSARSIQEVINKTKKKAGVTQEGGMHMLRHSFATHLLDKGIDIVFIQKLLGHNDIRTTLRYLHVTNKDLTHIISPLEDIEDLLKK